MKSDELANELVLMAEEDRAVCAALSTGGSLFDGYHPMMADLHRRNAERLDEIMDAVGWPGRKLIGGASWAPMLVLQNAIVTPRVMRRGLGLVRAAERRGEVEPLYVAVLEDRILTLEGRPQQYGTQFHWDDGGAARRGRRQATAAGSQIASSRHFSAAVTNASRAEFCTAAFQINVTWLGPMSSIGMTRTSGRR